MANEKPAWQQIVDLFEKNGCAPPPTKLRDELVVHLVAYQETRRTGLGPFNGYVVINGRRKGAVLDDMAFVWDDQEAAEDQKRDGEDDEVHPVRVFVQPQP